jgi:hypothetical protein
LRDLKRENRERIKKKEWKREGKEINAHRRESVHDSERSELRHSRCVREKRGGGGGGRVGAPQSRALTCQDMLKI